MSTKKHTSNHATTDDTTPAEPIAQATTEPPSHQAIAVRAYELYVARGCGNGCDMDDWLQAERELRGDDVAR